MTLVSDLPPKTAVVIVCVYQVNCHGGALAGLMQENPTENPTEELRDSKHSTLNVKCLKTKRKR